MIAKLFATEGSTETGLARFTFETTYKEAEKLGSFTGDDEFFIVKASKVLGSFSAEIVKLNDSEKNTLAASLDEVAPILEGMQWGDKCKLVCIASD